MGTDFLITETAMTAATVICRAAHMLVKNLMSGEEKSISGINVQR